MLSSVELREVEIGSSSDDDFETNFEAGNSPEFMKWYLEHGTKIEARDIAMRMFKSAERKTGRWSKAAVNVATSPEVVGTLTAAKDGLKKAGGAVAVASVPVLRSASSYISDMAKSWLGSDDDSSIEIPTENAFPIDIQSGFSENLEFSSNPLSTGSFDGPRIGADEGPSFIFYSDNQSASAEDDGYAVFTEPEVTTKSFKNMEISRALRGKGRLGHI